MEEWLTMGELFLLVETQRELKYEEQKYQAMLAGADVGGSGSAWEFDESNPDIMDGDGEGMFGITIK